MKESETTPPLLKIDKVTCVRGGRLLFEGLSLRLYAGDAAVATGPNGAGKSSLLRLAAGLLAPAAGQVARPPRVAFDTEAAALDPELPLEKALAYWARLDGGGKRQVKAGLNAVGLAGLAAVPVRMLSTGQRRRASLARVVASGAALWLLDEPGNGLDAAALARLSDAMAAHREGGGAILAASHSDLGLTGAEVVAL